MESRISQASPLRGGIKLIFTIRLLGRRQWMEHRLVGVKVDPDLEGGGEAADGGVGGGGRRGRQEAAAHSGHPGDGGGGGGGGLQGGDLQVVPEPHLHGLVGVEGGHPGALRPDGGGLGGVIGRGADTVRGLDRGGGDVGAVADGAVAPGPPDADVIILVTQVSLRRCDGGGGGVPVKAGDCS